MTRAIRRGRDVWGRRVVPEAGARQGSAWFDRRGRPRSARRGGRIVVAAVLVVAALLGFTTFALAADISNHTVLSNGRPEHHGTLDDAVWIPPADASWDLAPPSPTLDDARPDHRPALVDPPTRPGVPAPRGPTTPTTPTTPALTSPPVPAASPSMSMSMSTPMSTPSASGAPSSTPPTIGDTTPPGVPGDGGILGTGILGTGIPGVGLPGTGDTAPTGTGDPTTAPTGTAGVPDLDATTAPDAVVTPDTATAVAALDDARATTGCAPLRVDARLLDAATDHAEELAAGTGDTAPAPRMIAAGYPSPGGENVARGQASLAEATDELLASASHRANVVDCSFTAVGLAHAAGTQGDFWVQDFGR